MRKSNRKGFTIVELVIVIAVIAILAAVLIPTFANLVKKANVSADKQLVRQLNTILAAEEAADGKNPTMYDALQTVQRNGYLVENLTPTTTGYDILWNQESNRFALVDENGGAVYTNNDEDLPAKYQLWKIYTEVPVTAAQTYSIYLGNGATVSESINISVGLDVGDNTGITAINYTNTASAQNVVIRTNSFDTSLTVNAENDTVKHYGEASDVTVTAVAPDSYHEYGTVAFIEVAQGRVVVESKGAVDVMYVTGSGAVAQENGGTVTSAYASTSKVKADSLDAGTNVELIYDDEKTDEENRAAAEAARDKAIADAQANIFTVDDFYAAIENGGKYILGADLDLYDERTAWSIETATESVWSYDDPTNPILTTNKYYYWNPYYWLTQPNFADYSVAQFNASYNSGLTYEQWYANHFQSYASFTKTYIDIVVNKDIDLNLNGYIMTVGSLTLSAENITISNGTITRDDLYDSGAWAIPVVQGKAAKNITLTNVKVFGHGLASGPVLSATTQNSSTYSDTSLILNGCEVDGQVTLYNTNTSYKINLQANDSEINHVYNVAFNATIELNRCTVEGGGTTTAFYAVYVNLPAYNGITVKINDLTVGENLTAVFGTKCANFSSITIDEETYNSVTTGEIDLLSNLDDYGTWSEEPDADGNYVYKKNS